MQLHEMSRAVQALNLILGLLLSTTLISSVHTATTPAGSSTASNSGTSLGKEPPPQPDSRAETALTRMAPVGGPGGDAWDDLGLVNTVEPGAVINYPPHRRISEIHASCGDRPDSLSFVYRDNFSKVGLRSEIIKHGEVHGTETKNEKEKSLLLLDADEMITDVWLETCEVKHKTKKRHRICFIKIATTERSGDGAWTCGFSTWGGHGKPLATPTWSGGNSSGLFAFAGRSGEGIDQLSSDWGTRAAWGLGSAR